MLQCMPPRGVDHCKSRLESALQAQIYVMQSFLRLISLRDAICRKKNHSTVLKAVTTRSTGPHRMMLWNLRKPALPIGLPDSLTLLLLQLMRVDLTVQLVLPWSCKEVPAVRH